MYFTEFFLFYTATQRSRIQIACGCPLPAYGAQQLHKGLSSIFSCRENMLFSAFIGVDVRTCFLLLVISLFFQPCYHVFLFNRITQTAQWITLGSQNALVHCNTSVVRVLAPKESSIRFKLQGYR
jgi:hypothetical protein